MGRSPARRRLSLVMLVVGLCAGGLTGAWWVRNVKQQEILEIPPLEKLPYQNVAADVKFVGSEKCGQCHAEQAEGVRSTQHSRAFAEVTAEHADQLAVPRDSETDAVRVNPAVGGRSYEIARDSNGRMRHREQITTLDGRTVNLAQHIPKYVVGSGAHAHTYLMQEGEFLFESPITFYTEEQAWHLSPGFENSPQHPGFSRAINAACLNCHTGGTETVDDSFYKFTIREHAIGCERCHGPGELHVAKWQSTEAAASGAAGSKQVDPTIVNPAHLSRERIGAICAQCHLEGLTRIAVRGRYPQQFRPGRRFQDFEVAYVLRDERREMEVVGHVEQMRLSRCYTESETMTCVTCHDPHGSPPKEARVAYFRNKCLTCHQVDSCGVDQQQRHQQDQADNCMRCHMPQAETKVIHTSFTHHRIGIHAGGRKASGTPEDAAGADAAPAHAHGPGHDHSGTKGEAAGEVQAGQLVPLDDVSELPELEQRRCLALAYVELASTPIAAQLAEVYAQRGREMLEQLRKEGLRDAAVETALARIYYGFGEPKQALQRAEEALELPALSPVVRVDALQILANAHFDLGQWDAARKGFEELTRIRREPDDWRRLAACRFAAGETALALQAAQSAIDIAPHRAELHAEIGELHQDFNNTDDFRYHMKRAEQLDAVIGSGHSH